MNALMIREAKESDRELITELLTEELEHHVSLLPEIFQVADPIFTSAWFQDVLDNHRKLLFVAEIDGKVTGLILLQIKQSPDDPIYTPRLIVSVEELAPEPYRRQGIGRRLMDRALEWATKQEADAIELEVWEQNRGAIALYEGLGYEPIQ